MISPQVALVRPRAISPDSGETLPLDSIMLDLLSQRDRRVVQILGGPGAGKTTALRHLAALVLPGWQPLFLDDTAENDVAVHAAVRPVLCANRLPLRVADVVLRLAEWTDDDLIEYLLAVHPDRCASVMNRLRIDQDGPRLQGNPALWRIVLDEMARNESVATVRDGIERGLSRLLVSDAERQLAGQWSLAILGRDENTALRVLQQFARCDEDFDRIRPLRHSFVQRLLAAEYIDQRLMSTTRCEPLAMNLPESLIEEIARRVIDKASLRQRLLVVLDKEHDKFHAMAASILHATNMNWKPADGRVTCLRRGFFRHANWAELWLASAPTSPSDLSDADLTDANLTKAKLDGVVLYGTRLVRANLGGASLIAASATKADFSDADLSNVIADRMRLREVRLGRTRLNGASLVEADLQGSDLRGAHFWDAVLTRANLRGCQIEQADFSGATMHGVVAKKLPLRLATITGASFKEADLSECDFEEVELPDADCFKANLKSALFTASRMPRADFREANLRNAGLAQIQWENADLRGADLRGCSFHMGSSRSGLVGSPYPGHGSKTGFYTDDYYDQDYKVPEEIRKANLCGADLRDAKLDGVDFYLVDLRGAKFDAKAAEHLTRCGAILVDRQA